MSELKAELKKQLMGSHSTAKSKLVAKQIQSLSEIDALMSLISVDEDYPTPEAAAWCLRNACEHLKKHHFYISNLLVLKLPMCQRDSLLKNLLGTLKIIEIDPGSYGELTNLCLTYLTQPYRTKAVLYYSLEIMHRISSIEPELSRELLLICNDLLPLTSDAFKRKFAKVKKDIS